MSNPKHPIWGIIRLLILMTSLVITLWFTASNFDETEIKTIVWVFVAAASGEGITQFLSQFKPVAEKQ